MTPAHARAAWKSTNVQAWVLPVALALAVVLAFAPAALGCAGAPGGGPSTSSAVSSPPAAGVTGTGVTGTGGSDTTTGSGEPGAPAAAGEDDLVVDVVAEGLEVPWEIRFLPGGDLIVTERAGRLLRIDPATGASRELGRLPVAQRGEGGLMGLALDPGFPARPHVYVSYTYQLGGALTGVANRVSRLTLTDDTIGSEVVLLDGVPGAAVHDGSRVAFGPDGALWVTTGDAGEEDLARDLSSWAGKVLRMDRDGRPAAGNPFQDSLVYSYGHRNPQGLAWLPGDPEPFVTEHGPSTDDEVNHVRAGGDFGWPEARGAGGGPGFVDPVLSWTPTIAPAGAVFYESDAIPGWRGSMLVVTLKESDLRRLVPADAAFSAVAREDVLFDGRFGRLRALAVGPDGWLYVGTSNRDGRGDPRAGDDRILRIRTE